MFIIAQVKRLSLLQIYSEFMRIVFLGKLERDTTKEALSFQFELNFQQNKYPILPNTGFLFIHLYS